MGQPPPGHAEFLVHLEYALKHDPHLAALVRHYLGSRAGSEPEQYGLGNVLRKANAAVQRGAYEISPLLAGLGRGADLTGHGPLWTDTLRQKGEARLAKARAMRTPPPA